MATTSLIKRHIAISSAKTIFSSRDFLAYGQRTAVDIALWRLVDSGYLVRVARGLFIKWTQNLELPSLAAIAAAKAKAFGKTLFTDGADAARQLGHGSGNSTPTFATTGRSTSFDALSDRKDYYALSASRTNRGDISRAVTRIHFRSAPQKLVSLADSPNGLAVRALHYLNTNNNNNENINRKRAAKNDQLKEVCAKILQPMHNKTVPNFLLEITKAMPFALSDTLFKMTRAVTFDGLKVHFAWQKQLKTMKAA